MSKKCAKCLKIADLDMKKTIFCAKFNTMTTHTKDFLCKVCDKRVKGTSFFPDFKTCTDCLEQHSPKCFKCKTALQSKLGPYSRILDDDTFEKQFYHRDCLECSKCNQILEDGFYKRSDLLICLKCKEEEIRNSYHEECLTCEKCKNSVENVAFFKLSVGIVCINCLEEEE